MFPWAVVVKTQQNRLKNMPFPTKQLIPITLTLTLLALTIGCGPEIKAKLTTIEDYNMAIKSDSQDTVPYNNRGVAYLNKGEVDKAIEDFNKAIECDPEDANAYNNLGVAYFDKGEIDKVIKEYSTAIKLKPEYLMLMVIGVWLGCT